VAKYRISGLAELARSMAFTPSESRWAQTAAAETLLNELDPARSYPLDFVIYRITNFRPALRHESDLASGSSLQHDLGLLIEQVSASLAARPADLSEPVLSILDVCQRFDVTSKTIQRWRRKGLAGRRFLFPDGRLRVGFLLASVERFIARQDSGCNGDNACGQISLGQLQQILRHARRLALAGCWPAEIARRVGKRTGHSALAILHTVRKHDHEQTAAAIFPLAPLPPTAAERARVLRGRQRGISLLRIARRMGRPRGAVARMLLEQRAARLSVRKVRFIDDPLYHGPLAEQTVDAIVSQEPLADAPSPEERRLPRDLPPYLRELYRHPLLPASKERALFLKFNFHKWQFATARRQLDPQLATARQLDWLESVLSAATATKNQILRANLRLVVSVARKHVRPGLPLMELVSEGNLTLMRAAESFDIHKGNRFSTYATLALMKGFARAVPAMLSDRIDTGGSIELEGELADPRGGQTDSRLDEMDQLWTLVGQLEEEERWALLDHFDLEASPTSDRALANEPESPSSRRHWSKQRRRQLRQSALTKLRRAAREH
jgi:RNA polymerase primary sigma factor